jgi:hypothetical protein
MAIKQRLPLRITILGITKAASVTKVNTAICLLHKEICFARRAPRNRRPSSYRTGTPAEDIRQRVVLGPHRHPPVGRHIEKIREAAGPQYGKQHPQPGRQCNAHKLQTLDRQGRPGLVDETHAGKPVVVVALPDRRGLEPALAIILERLLDLHLGVHNERPSARHRFVKRPAGHDQKARCFVSGFNPEDITTSQHTQVITF